VEIEFAGEPVDHCHEASNGAISSCLFALAAWTKLLIPSISPLAIPLSNHRRMPSQWRLMVRAASMTGGRWLCVAQKYRRLRNAARLGQVMLTEFLACEAESGRRVRS
jgi:hypothetical protein